MLHAIAASLTLLFAPPSAPDSAADAATAVDVAAGQMPADDTMALDPNVAAMIASLSPEAQTKLDALGETELQEMIGRYFDNKPLDPQEKEIAEAYVQMQLSIADAALNYQTGDITIGSGLAVLHLGDSFRYLPPADARTVIVDHWGNPPENGESLGMIVPTSTSPVHPTQGWGVIVTYTEDGHVEDDDAEDIDYDELLEEMQESTTADNEARKQRGFPEMTLVGWAAKPRYDSTTKRMYWAKELAVVGAPEHTLNYDIRVLGRKGVLELSAIGAMSQLDAIGPDMERVLSKVEFEDGNKYSDFDPDLDSVAAYGIGGLVAGKLLAKAGLFAVLLKFLIAGKKLLFVGVIAVGLFFKKLVGRKTEEE